MRDGSDAIADWPILNALSHRRRGLLGVGASWGRRGHRYSVHAGMVVVADGTAEAAAPPGAVLNTDPGTGVMRHAMPATPKPSPLPGNAASSCR